MGYRCQMLVRHVLAFLLWYQSQRNASWSVPVERIKVPLYNSALPHVPPKAVLTDTAPSPRALVCCPQRSPVALILGNENTQPV